MARKATAQKTGKKISPKEKIEVFRAESAVLTERLADMERRLEEMGRLTTQELSQLSQKLADIERRLDEGGKSAARDASRMSKTLSDFNVRLSSVAANVLEVSAVAARAADLADRPERKSNLWGNHKVELKK